MATNIVDLTEVYSDDDCDLTSIDIDNISDRDKLGEIVIDFSISEKNRIKALEKYYGNFELDIAEIVNKITGMYIFSRTKMLEDFLYSLCIKSSLPNNIKVIMAKGLSTHGKNLGFIALNHLCQDLSDVPTPVQIDTIKCLFDSDEYRDNGLKYFIIVINNNDISCDFRYKTILSLEHDNDDLESLISDPDDSDDERENDKIKENNEKTRIKNEYLIYATKQSLSSFFYNNDNMIMYRLLAGQNLLLNHIKDDKERENIENTIINLAEDSSVEYNLRADAADVILQLGNNKQRAQNVILQLGNVEGKARTLFENAQNAHYDEFAKSVNEGIDFLNTIPMLKINDVAITFEYVRKQVNDLIKKKYGNKPSNTDKDVIEKIIIALNRINMDRALYSKYNCTLIAILLKVWTYIASHKHGDAMKQRILEELHDMAGICSTGFAERLINVISGFGDFNFRISFEEQIVANFSGRLTSRAKNIVNEWNSINRLVNVANILINMDSEVSKDVLKRYLKDNNLLQKYEYTIQGPYRKKVNTFKDNNEYDKVLIKLSNDGNAPNNEQRYNTYIKILEEEQGVKNPNFYILEEFQSNVLVEISINTQDSADRLCFLSFLREEMLSIREELYKEFNEYVSDQDFDNYFRTAISKYETG